MVDMYELIDQVKSGKKLKIMLESAGYDVKYIQDYLQLSCPQSIYRWYKGQALPSLEHLSALSRLLGVHMEQLLVLQGETLVHSLSLSLKEKRMKRIVRYVTYLKRLHEIY